MLSPIYIFAILFAYLIGSIPSAVWIGKWLYNVDVREHGSGNAGATNTFRVLGKRAGIPVLFIDIFKGWLAVNLAFLVSVKEPGSNNFLEMQMVLGVAALFGHIFPILASFRGGKGIATMFGVVIAIHPSAALIALIVFLIIFFAFNYVSLASICAASSFPLTFMFIYPAQVPTLVLFGFLILLLVLITHQKNIERLVRKEESKIKLTKHIAKTNSEETIN